MRFGYRDSEASGSDSDGDGDDELELELELPVHPPRLLSKSSKSSSSSTAPFVPKPINFKRPPIRRPSIHKHSRERTRSTTSSYLSNDTPPSSPSSTSSSSENDSEDSDSDNLPAVLMDPDSSSDLSGSEDSEEELYPVGPLRSIGPRTGFRTLPASSTSSVGGATDAFETWDKTSRSQAWRAANLSFSNGLRSAGAGVKGGATTAKGSKRERGKEEELRGIETLLNALSLQREREHKVLVDSFEQRNKALWKSIEDSIKEAGLVELRKEQEREQDAKRRRDEEEAKKKKEEDDRKKRDEEVAKQKKEEEDKKKAEEEKVRLAKVKEEEDKAKLAASLIPKDPNTPEGAYLRWVSLMAAIKTLILPVVSSTPNYRSTCFKAKRSITPKIGQLTASLSATHTILQALNQTLLSLLPSTSPTPPKSFSQFLPPPSPTPSTPTTPNFMGLESYFWALNHLSKALIKQAETETTARVETCFPLGRVVVGLIGMGHESLGEVLMSRLVKKCWWITGFVPKKLPTQTPDAYAKTLGLVPSETAQSYSIRMSGLLALYSAICQTPPLSPPPPPHFRPSALWTLIVLLLQNPRLWPPPPSAPPPNPSLQNQGTPARNDETPLLIFTILQVAGTGLEESFGKQWKKLLKVVWAETARVAREGPGGPVRKSGLARIELWLGEWEQKGAKGMELDGRNGDP